MISHAFKTISRTSMLSCSLWKKSHQQASKVRQTQSHSCTTSNNCKSILMTLPLNNSKLILMFTQVTCQENWPNNSWRTSTMKSSAIYSNTRTTLFGNFLKNSKRSTISNRMNLIKKRGTRWRNGPNLWTNMLMSYKSSIWSVLSVVNTYQTSQWIKNARRIRLFGMPMSTLRRRSPMRDPCTTEDTGLANPNVKWLN